MRQFWVIMRRTAFAVLLLLLVGVVALAVITHTEEFREFARKQLVTTVNNSIDGSVSLGRLEGSLWGNITLHDIAIRHEGDKIFQVPRLRLAYSLLPLLWRQLQILEVEAVRPSLYLVQSEDNQWNIVQALSTKQPAEPEDSGLTVLLNSLVLSGGQIDLRLAGAEPQSYAFSDVMLNSRIHVGPRAVIIEINRVASGMTAPGLPPVNIDGALVYRGTDKTDTIDVSALSLVSGESRVNLTGKVEDRETTEVHAKVAVQRLAPADARRVIAEWPIKADVAGTIAVDGPLEALAVDLDLAAAGAKMAADLTLDVAQETPRYQGTVKVSGFNVKTLLARDDIAGVLSGAVTGKGVGFNLPDIDAQGTINLQSAAVAGWQLGNVAVDARLHENVAKISGKLESKVGGATWNGRISLKEKPAYEIALVVNDLDVEQATGNNSALAGKINLKGSVQGTGLDLAEMTAQADLQILPSTIGPVQVQRGTVVASLKEQRLRIAQATLRTEDANLTVEGNIGLDPQQNGRLNYRFRSENVSPWLALFDQQGSGSVDLTGEVTGNIAALQSQGTLKVATLRLDENAVATGHIEFALRQPGLKSLPQGMMQVRLTGVDAGIDLRRVEGSIALSAGEPYEIRLDLKAADGSNRMHALAAQIAYRRDLIVARLDQLRLSLDDGPWQLARRATITQRGESFDVSDLVLRNEARQIAIDGRFATTGKQDLDVNIDGFPISAISAWLPNRLPLSGTVNARAHVGGTAAAPEIVASANLHDTSIAGQRYRGIVGSAIYRNRAADFKLTVHQDETHTLTATGTVPLVLRWSPSWQAQAGGAINARIQSSGLNVAFLNAFVGEAAQNITGNISLDIAAQGPITQPTARGTFQLEDGGVMVKPLGIQISAITADGRIDGQTVLLRQIFAQAKDGRLSGSGSLALRNYHAENFELSLSLSRWPVIQTQRYRAAVEGTIQAQGPLAKPLLTGQIEVLSADLRPDLAFLSRGKTPLARDETIVIVRREKPVEKAATPPAKKPQPAAEPEYDLVKNARLDLTVAMPNQVWIRHPDANIELSGKMRAVKNTGEDIALTGTINVVRGWIAFQGRRFNLVRGTIDFRGGEKINPALEILAQYRLPDYQIEVVVSGTLDKLALNLRSEPPLEQGDILALLIFGKPLTALGRSEQTTLQQSAVDLASGFAAATIGNAISESLGLDRLGLDIGELDFSGGQVGFGRYVGDKTYVSISQDLSGETGREVAIEYRIGPDWKIVTSTSTTGESGIGILWHKRY